MTTASDHDRDDDVLAGSFIMNGNDGLITLTDDMFAETPEETARLQADLAMITDDRVYATRLAELRRVMGWTQTEVGQRMNASQPAVATIEARSDMRISTRARYLTAIGGKADSKSPSPTTKAFSTTRPRTTVPSGTA